MTLPCYRRASVPGPGRGRAAGGGVGQPGLHLHHLLQGEHWADIEIPQKFHKDLLTAAVDMVAGLRLHLPYLPIYPNPELKLLQRILTRVASGWFWVIRDCPDAPAVIGSNK